ncbi:phosphoribosyl-AMP cyclohydrolase [Pseudoclavibacter endophyticus]|uniref:Histidine biosynthesis bifunctional protein HisIE n=1 Tax=Pseudoclavibacter endophyticus TaxID=1778590 RepID=A0A6H9WLR9_9MICO|nr:phosphoribosyl-AMP cyclohydrolase [Pseudoclavibacter endophyticus]KAB1650103.1 phosphoribosyl-AMP cyclohydrolase [Pseudoclavibacter endophyticus]GGA57199.1 phosphoribosyl-AMP cyclohydrolase [Pseudoclavibacter endophyticus]
MSANERVAAALTDEQIEEVVGRIAFDERGLAPAIVTQHGTGELLMLAYVSAESLRATLSDRRVTYWSRSRRELWRKGETSGHTQRLMAFALDCDADTLHFEVDQVGPACHTGTRTCFDGDELAVRFADATGERA